MRLPLLFLVLAATIPIRAGEKPTAPVPTPGQRNAPFTQPLLLNAGPLDEAESLMQARKYAETAAKLDDATMKSAADPAYARYLRALAKHRANQHESAIIDCDAVPVESVWHWKAVFVKAQCLAELRRHQEAEAVYSAEAARLFATTRKEKLAGVLSSYATELLKEPLPGEAPTAQNRTRALELFRKALDIETGAATREELLYKQAVVLRDLGHVKEIDAVCLVYLREFDQDWTGPLGSIERSRGQKNPKATAGAHRFEVRMMLAENALKLNNRLATRQYAQDLLDLWKAKPPQPGSKPDAGDAEWLLCRSHAPLQYRAEEVQNNNSHQGELAISNHGDPTQRVESLRSFLKDHPQHARAAEASTALALSIAAQGKTEDAITALDTFLKTEWTVPNTKLADWQQEAFFTIGSLRFNLKQYDKAIAQWREYSAKYPNGSLWQQAQSRIIDAEFQLCLEPVAANDEAAARKRFDEFIAKHPLDLRAPQLLFLIGQFSFAKAQELEKKVGRQPSADIRALQEIAIAEWAKLISKYPSSEEASLAMYRTGVLQMGPLERYEEGLATFKKLTWGGWKEMARERAAMLPQKSLALSTERVFRNHEKPSVHVAVRNIEKLKVSVYKLGLEDFFRSRHRLDGNTGIESLDIDLIQPDKTWEVPVAGYSRLKSIEQEIEVPFDDAQPGVKIVRVEGDDWQASTVVIRSDVDFIIESAWKEGLVFAVNRVTNKPVAGAEVLISDGKKIIGQGKTAADGVFRLKGEMIREAADLCVHLRSPQGEAVHRLNLRGMTQEIIENVSSDERIVTLSRRGYIYTDRSAYRPGETVYFRAIIRDVKDGAYTVPEGRVYKVKVMGEQGRVLRESNEKLSAFGTITMSVPIPYGAPEGQYSIVATAEDGIEKHRGAFEVSHFDLPDVQLNVELKPEIAFRGDTIKGIIRARHYFGSAVKDEIVRVTMPDGRLLEGRTDAEGAFAFTQETSGFQPGALLAFGAQLPSKKIGASGSTMLQTTGVHLAWDRLPQTVVAGEASTLRVKAQSPDGKPLETTAKLTIYRREKTESNDVLGGLPGINYLSAAKEPAKISEVEIKTDAKTGIAIVPFTLAAGGGHTIVVEAKDSRGNPVSISSSVFASADDDAVKLRLFADETEVDEGAAINVRAHSRIDAPLALVTIAGEDIIEHRIVSLKPGHNALGVNVAAAHWPRFDVTVAFLDGRKLHRERETFIVKRQLKLAITPSADTLEPGSEAEIKLSATDQQGHPVKAELSLALVNDALYAQYPDSTDDIVEFFQRGSRTGSSFRFDSSAAFMHRAKSRQVQIAAEGAAPRTVAALNHVDRIRALEAREAEVYQQRGRGQQVSIDSLFVNNFITANTITSGNRSGDQGINGFVEVQEFDGFINYGSPIQSGRRYFWTDNESAKLNLNPSGGANSPRDAQWHCPIVTDAAGNASVKLKLPAQHGSWRLGAKGCTVSTLVGAAEKHIITRQSLFVELQQPVALREGDVWRPELVVHALDGAERDVNLMVALALPDGEKKSEKKVRVKPGQSVPVYLDAVTVPRGVDVLRWSAECTVGAMKAATSAGIVVNPWQVTDLAQAGAMGRGSVKLNPWLSKLPDNAKPLDHRRIVTVHFSAADMLFDMALHRAPRVPGVEPLKHTASSNLLTAVSALRVAKASNSSADRITMLEAVIRGLISELQITQNYGGWSWQEVQWGPDSIVTSQALWGLREASALGFAVNERTFKAAVKFLKAALITIPPGEPEKAAVILHALALEKEADFSVANRLYRDRASLNFPAQAYLAGAFLRMERKDEANALLESIQLTPNRSSRIPVQTTGSQIVARLRSDDDTAAIILWALAKGKSSSPTRSERVLQRLLQNGGVALGEASALQGVWAAALAEHFLTQPDLIKAAAFDGELTVNGKLWRKITQDDLSKTTAFIVPDELLKDADEVAVEVRGAQPALFVHATEVRLQLHENRDEMPMSRQLSGSNSFSHPSITRRVYLHDTMRHKDMPLKAASTSPVSVASHGQMIHVEVDIKNPENMRQSYYTLDETVPAGCFVLDGSLRSNHVKMEPTLSGFRLWFQPGDIGNVRYTLVAQHPGKWKVPGNELREWLAPPSLRTGALMTITVLPPGEPVTEVYVMNREERFELAAKYFAENDFAQARTLLDVLQGDAEARKLYERDIDRMLLWIHTAQPEMDARRVVELFETLSERHADLVIPFDKILRVAAAYRQIGEFERSWLVDRATIESSFVRDSRVSVALRVAGDFLGGAEHQLALWSEYPDVPDVLLAFFSLAQDFQDKAADAASLTVRAGALKPTKTGLLEKSRDLLRRYLVFYADDAAADGVAFNLSNVFFDLNDYAKVAAQAESAIAAYPKSSFLSSFQYMAALGHFWQYEFPKAISSAAPVASGNSSDAPNARYITAQIHHAQGHPQEAIDWYKKVRDEFPDAGESISYLEEKRIVLPAATNFKPGQSVKLELSSRNVKEAALKIYKVDLLKLHDRSSSLSDVTKVNLAGITPEAEMKVALGEGRDFAWKRRTMDLPVKKEGAYLVICRGDDLFTSALVLVTPLELEVREDNESGAVRVQLKDAAKGSYLADAEAKIIDSNSGTPIAGRTDPRGSFQADDISGFATVVVKHGETRYAYYKSATMIRPALVSGQKQSNQPNAEAPRPDPFAPQRPADQGQRMQHGEPKTMSKKTYLLNVKEQLKGNMTDNKINWEAKMSQGGKGVEVKKAMKK